MLNENDNLKIWQRLVSSSTGAVVNTIIVTPLDVIKTRIQIQNKPIVSGSELTDNIYQFVNGNKKLLTTKFYEKDLKFNNSFDTLRKIVKTEGLISLWSGLSPALILAVPQVVIYYTLNDWLKYATGYANYTKSSQNNLISSRSFLNKEDLLPPFCGIIARVVVQTTIAPLELMRTKMQSERLRYFEMRKIIVLDFKQGGITMLWRGLGPTLWRDIPFGIALWFTYEYLKKQYLIKNKSCAEDSYVPQHWTFLFSACGAVAAGIVSQPFDVTKTHRQVELGNANLHNKRLSGSTLTYLFMLKRTNGYSSLFSGFYPRILRVVIATATMITIFETVKDAFIKFNKRNR